MHWDADSILTYGAVLLMDEKVSGEVKKDPSDWTARDSIFLSLILLWNLLFMICVGIMIVRDMLRHAGDHVAEHGVRQSLKDLKSAIKEAAQVDKIKAAVEQVTSIATPRNRNKEEEEAARRKGTVVGKGSVAEMMLRRERKRKKDAARLLWLRGFAGAATVCVRIRLVVSSVSHSVNSNAKT